MRRSAFEFRSDRRHTLPALLVVTFLAMAPTAFLRAQSLATGPFRPEAVHAVLLINFIRFTDWPAEVLPVNAPIVVGVAGSRALEDELIRLAEKQSERSQRVHVVRVVTVRQLDGCHVLYISPISHPGEESPSPVAELLSHVRNRPVLTVSTSQDFLAKGGIVNFYQDSGTGSVRFAIAPTIARANGLQLSSRLLALAKIVE
jgi:hypothetical protein